jgi:carbonic anhydrase
VFFSSFSTFYSLLSTLDFRLSVRLLRTVFREGTVRHTTITAVLLVAAMGLSPAAARAQVAHGSEWKTEWGYQGAIGPDHWAGLAPEYAACNGKRQSPLDIRTASKAQLPALHFDYRSAPLTIDNNGVTIRVNYPPGASNDFLVVGDTRYQLVQFHFHRPSEEYINGKPYPMALHLMHKSGDGKIVGVTVMLVPGAANATVQQLWDHMPMTPGPDQKVAGVAVNPADLLPPSYGYYTYAGSLTAPPCTEGVTWIVLKYPVEISPAQIAAFARLFPHDVRPPQPLNGRVVQESR